MSAVFSLRQRARRASPLERAVGWGFVLFGVASLVGGCAIDDEGLRDEAHGRASRALEDSLGIFDPLLGAPCGGLNEPCCSPYVAEGGVTGPSHCNAGLGCDIATNQCVAPCGAANQVCCDGPDTTAGQGGPVYCPGGDLNLCVVRKEMCSGGTCNPATRRCVACGNRIGQACCPPDVTSGLGHCMLEDALTGESMVCQDPYAGAGSSCVACGAKGAPPCIGNWCTDGLAVRDDRCVEAGALDQPCAEFGPGPTCKGWLECVSGVCRPCGGMGQDCCAPDQACQWFDRLSCVQGVCSDPDPATRECFYYARDAITANEENLSGGCGYEGDTWSSDYLHHYLWCIEVDTTSINAEADARRKALHQCNGCHAYARYKLDTLKKDPSEHGLFFAQCMERGGKDDYPTSSRGSGGSGSGGSGWGGSGWGAGGSPRCCLVNPCPLSQPQPPGGSPSPPGCYMCGYPWCR